MTELLDHTISIDPDDGDRADAGEPSGPVEWAERDARLAAWFPPTEHTWDTIQRVVTVVTVALCALYTFSQLHPSLVLRNTTPAGGDMGAHVWAPAYLRDHILPHWRLSGWAPDWYAGFPMYQFYMVVPALMVVGLNVLLPYGVALKIVSVLGIVSLPITAWAFGRLSGMKFPYPPLLSMAAVLFLFDESFTIYGGNIASTMAGEYSFSIALSLAMLFFGIFAYGLRTGKRSGWAAAVAALAALSHGIVLFFVIFGALALFALWFSRERLRYVLPVGVVAFLLGAFWLLPFRLRQGFGTDMFYERRPVGNAPNGGGKIADSYWQMFFPQALWVDRLIFVMMVVGIVGAVVRRSRPALFFALVMTFYWAWAWVWPQSLLWNARLLPFMYLCRYLLVACGVAELLWAAGRLIRPFDRDVARTAASVGVIAVLLATVTTVAVHLQNLPFGTEHVVKTKAHPDGTWVYDWGPFRMSTNGRGFVDSWARWNYAGYEAKDAYGEYYGVVSKMRAIGDDPKLGCGRALWENNNDQDKYGTPMALMLLPFWTDGCIGSMEGLFFEASGTTPYHFLATSAMSKKSSDPVRRLKYEDGDVDKGVGYLQSLGVRYYLAYSPDIVAKAAKNAALHEIATSGPWHVYQVADSDLVVPMATQPVVANIDWENRDRWLELGTSWFQHQDEWVAMPAADGPKEWQRIDVTQLSDKKTDEKNLAEVGPAGDVKAVDQPTITVSNTATGDDFVSFDVDKVGVPVLVKMSYFPNWKVSGAKGPYRVAPNLMVVVPTSKHVRLHYGFTGLDLFSYFLSFLGLVGLVGLAWRGRVEFGKRWTPARIGAEPGPEFGPAHPGPYAIGAGAVPADDGGQDFVRDPMRFDASAPAAPAGHSVPDALKIPSTPVDDQGGVLGAPGDGSSLAMPVPPPSPPAVALPAPAPMPPPDPTTLAGSPNPPTE